MQTPWRTCMDSVGAINNNYYLHFKPVVMNEPEPIMYLKKYKILFQRMNKIGRPVELKIEHLDANSFTDAIDKFHKDNAGKFYRMIQISLNKL